MTIVDSPTLLLVGKDRLLLQTRRSVLRTAGFAAILAEKAADACVAARHLHFHAVLVCHTLNEAERAQLMNDFRQYQADVPMLPLTKNNVEPRSLISTVQQAVGMAARHLEMPPQRGDDGSQSQAS